MNRHEWFLGKSGKETWPRAGEDWMIKLCKTRTGKIVKVATGTNGEFRVAIKYESHDFPLYYTPDYFLANFKRKI